MGKKHRRHIDTRPALAPLNHSSQYIAPTANSHRLGRCSVPSRQQVPDAPGRRDGPSRHTHRASPYRRPSPTAKYGPHQRSRDHQGPQPVALFPPGPPAARRVVRRSRSPPTLRREQPRTVTPAPDAARTAMEPTALSPTRDAPATALSPVDKQAASSKGSSTRSDRSKGRAWSADSSSGSDSSAESAYDSGSDGEGSAHRQVASRPRLPATTAPGPPGIEELPDIATESIRNLVPAAECSDIPVPSESIELPLHSPPHVEFDDIFQPLWIEGNGVQCRVRRIPVGSSDLLILPLPPHQDGPSVFLRYTNPHTRPDIVNFDAVHQAFVQARENQEIELDYTVRQVEMRADRAYLHTTWAALPARQVALTATKSLFASIEPHENKANCIATLADGQWLVDSQSLL